MDGGGRRGRKLMRQSQIAPTVNAIAQAEWLSLNLGNDIVVEQAASRTTRKPWEAMAIHEFYAEGDLRKAFDCAEHWIEDEPYNPMSYATARSPLISWRISRRREQFRRRD